MSEFKGKRAGEQSIVEPELSGRGFEPQQEIEDLEIELLLQGITQRYGYDLRDYSRAFMKRRIYRRVSLEGFGNISELQHALLGDERCFDRLLLDLSINVTEMFRDPSFFRAVREQIVPFLRDLPHIKIWHAGCATGEEVYSMAILLLEEGLYDRTIIYATDFNKSVIEEAREGIYPNDLIKLYTANYHKAGGSGTFSDYYTADYNWAIISKALKKNVVFAMHNLATDGVLGEVNVIMCRNVLIYFNRELQDRSLGIFLESLVAGGYLCLGSRESVEFSRYRDFFEKTVKSEKIYRRNKMAGKPVSRDMIPLSEGGIAAVTAKKSGNERIEGMTKGGGLLHEAVVIGVSAGGMNALGKILPSLPDDFPLPVIVVQHQHDTSDNFLARFLDERCRLHVKEASEKEKIVVGTVYIAPPRYHLMVERDRTFSLSVEEPVSYARPSIDVLFETAADVYRQGLIGIILTGANRDGRQGLKKVKERGGIALVQDPADAEADSMPKAAIAFTEVDRILALENMGDFLKKIVSGEIVV